VLLGTLVALLALLEVGTRLLTRTPPNLLVRAPRVGKTYVPGFEGEVFIPEAGKEIFLRFNREGFRGVDLSIEKPPGVRRVAVLGDSFIAAMATDEERTLVSGLEARLDSWDEAGDWQVMNFGMSGSSTGQELALFREVVAPYRPDLVVCAFSILNDFADNSRRLSRAPRIYYDFDDDGELRQLPLSEASSKVTNWLNRHSTFYRWQKNAQAVVRYRLLAAAEDFRPGRWIFSTEDTEDTAHSWKLLASLIERFASEVEDSGGQLVLVALPSAEQVYDDRWERMLVLAGAAGAQFDADYPARRLSEMASASGVPFLSLREQFRAAAPRSSSEVPEEWLYFDGHGHFNDAGHALVAAEIFDWITKLPALQAPAAEEI
jgi:lysophospholipase L1-like esterase